MVGKGQWVLLMYLVAQNLPGLLLSPPVVKEEMYLQPRRLGDHSYYKLNYSNLPLDKLSPIQYEQALDRLPREIVFQNPHGELSTY